MAISGGDYRVKNDLQQSLSNDMNSSIDAVNSTIGNYSSSNYEDRFILKDIDNSKNSHDFVGITPEMLSKITGAIDSYSSNLNGILDGMPDTVDYAQAFRGTGVETAVKSFVISVKELCKSYLESLKLAENQIIESVNAQYQASDQDVAGQLNSDTSGISK